MKLKLTKDDIHSLRWWLFNDLHFFISQLKDNVLHLDLKWQEQATMWQ